MKQVLFREIYDENEHPQPLMGIQLDDGSVICADCGELFEAEEVEVLESYEWVNFTYEIRSDLFDEMYESYVRSINHSLED